ncbi:MAG: hypothetical protein JSS90_07035 [Bacteroidetes bacterium]|nr:hypothetical protein [Bacteroidota bacterium]
MFTKTKFGFQQILIVFLLFFTLATTIGYAQTKKTLTITAKFKIEGGGSLSDAYMVLQRDGQNIETLPGQSSYTLNLEIGADYVLSFNKPGYINKKININTVVDDEERVEQGFESYPFTVVLIKQYEGVNVVVFNQPVAKITYSKKYDEFDYDTDYTKSIQSAIQKAEEDLKRAEKEFKKNPPKPAVDSTLAKNKTQQQEEKPKSKETQKPADKVSEKTPVENTAENKTPAKTESPATTTDKKRDVTKKQAKAAGGEDVSKSAQSSGGEDEQVVDLSENKGQDIKQPIEPKQGEDALKGKISKKGGRDQPPAADVKKNDAAVIIKSEKNTEPAKPAQQMSITQVPANVSITRETISEDKRTVYNVHVTVGDKTALFSKVVYNWGGVFYFRDMKISISENMFRQADAGNAKF